MKSPNHVLHYFTLGLIVSISLLTGCGLLNRDPLVDDFINWLGISEEYYNNLPTCEQVRLYSDLAPYFYGVHALEATPSAPIFMTEALSNDGQEVAPCIVSEASARLSNSKDPRNIWRVRALNVLIEKLQTDYFSHGGRIGADFSFPEAQTYLSRVVCASPSSQSDEATRAFYIIKFHRVPGDDFPSPSEDFAPPPSELFATPPSDAFSSQGIEKMKEMLCK